MRINSKTKGKTGELELAALFREHGFAARRGQQFSGIGESPDIVHNIPGIHVECKRTESLQLWPALAQATKDAKHGAIPTVWHRPSRKDWIVIMPAEAFLKLLKGASE